METRNVHFFQSSLPGSKEKIQERRASTIRASFEAAPQQGLESVIVESRQGAASRFISRADVR